MENIVDENKEAATATTETAAKEQTGKQGETENAVAHVEETQNKEEDVRFEDLPEKKKQAILAEIQKYGDLSTWLENNGRTFSNERDRLLVRDLAAYGVTLEEYLKNRQFYHKNRHLFEGKTKSKEKKIQDLIKQWRKYFEGKGEEAEEECNRKWHLISTLAIGAELSPIAFAKRYNWKTYFDVEPPETVAGIVKQMVKNIAKEVITDLLLPDEPSVTPEQRIERRKEFAKVLWGATNEKRKNDAKKENTPFVLGVDEKAVQSLAIEKGIPPELKMVEEEGEEKPVETSVLINAELNEDDRVTKVEDLIKDLLPGVSFAGLTDDQKREFLIIHRSIGKGVYKLSEREVVLKAKELHNWLKKLGIEDLRTDYALRHGLVDRFIRSGLAGNGQPEAPDASDSQRSPRSEEERVRDAISRLRSLTKEEQQRVSDLFNMLKLRYPKTPWNPYDPTFINFAADIVKRIPAGEKIYGAELDKFIRDMETKGVLPAAEQVEDDAKEIEGRVHTLTDEELRVNQAMWDAWAQMLAAEIEAIPDKGRSQFQKDFQWAKENGFTPDQLNLDPSHYGKEFNYGRDYREGMEDDDREEIESTDIETGPMDPETKRFFDKQWDRQENTLRQAGEDVDDPAVQEQIQKAKREGKWPGEVDIQFPRSSVPLEKQQEAQDAWEIHARFRAKSGNPLSPEELKDARKKWRQGIFPPSIGGASDYLPPQLEGRRRRKGGGPTMWEKVQSLRVPGASESEILREEQYTYEYETPKNVYDFAWQIGMSSPEKYGVLGEHPVLEVVYAESGIGTEDGETYRYTQGERVTREQDLYDPAKTESRVNKANFVRWVRDRMIYLHGDNPDDVLDFAKEIYLTKAYSVNLGNALNSPEVFFRDVKLTKYRQDLRVELKQARKSGSINPRTNQPYAEADITQLETEFKRLPKTDNMEDLLNEIKRETWAFYVTRRNDLNYRARSGDKQEFVRMMIEMFARSEFTKTVWDGRSLLDWALTMDLEYGKNDHKVGAAIAGAYKVYYNLTDTERIREVLGPESRLLSKSGLKEIRDQAAGITKEDGKMGVIVKRMVDGQEIEEFVEKNDEELKLIRSNYFSDKSINGLFAYDEEQVKDIKRIFKEQGLPQKNFVPFTGEDGKPYWREVDERGNDVINEWKFIKAFNIFSSPQFDTRAERMVHLAIQADIADRYDLKLDVEGVGRKEVDPLSVEFAQTFAYTMSRWTGAQPRNNQSAAGYDAWVALIKTRTYRRKYSESNRGEAFGIPYTVDQVRGVNTDLMTGIRTETKISADDRNPDKNPFADLYAGRSSDSYKTPMEVIDEMLDVWENEASPEERARLYREKSSQLRFPGNTQKYFAFDQIKRGMEIYDQIIDAAEIKIETFTKIDPIKGVTFERDKFQQAVQDKFLKPMRYLLSTWKQVDFGQMVWDNRGEESHTAWRQVTMAEKMFGHQMLDVAEFWERIEEPKEGDEDYDRKMREFRERIKQKGVVKRRTRNSEGEWEETYRIEHKISGKEINDNRTQLIKQLAKTRIAAELYAHVDLHSNDPRYDFRFYETIIQALERIPGGVTGDDRDIKSAKTILDPDRRYFSGEDIAWIRKASHTERWRIYGWAILKAILWDGMIKGGIEGFEKAGEGVMKDIVAAK